jgi:hypothetical protein
MGVTPPDPETFGKSGPKPWEEIDPDDYTSLFEVEEDNEGD